MNEDRKLTWRDAGLCLSLANLCFLGSWEELYRIHGSAAGGISGEPALALLCATLVNVLGLAAASLAAVYAVRRYGSGLLSVAARCAFLIALLTPLDLIGWKLFHSFRETSAAPAIKYLWTATLVLPVVGCLFLALYGKDTIYWAAKTLVLVLLPVVFFNFGKIGWAVAESLRAEIRPAMAPPLTPKNKGRVLWLVFDELDQRLAFDVRPASVRMPELLKLRREGLSSTKAVSPAWETAESMSSLLLGRKAETFSGAPTVFARARQAGFNTALVGWFLPYCASLAESLTACAQPTEANMKSRNVMPHVREQWERLLSENWVAIRFGREAQYRIPWFGFAARNEQRLAYEYTLREARKLAVSSDYGLVLLHWPIPHPLGIYNRNLKRLDLTHTNNYFDNLELMDQTIGELRSLLERANLWETTHLIVSSDHPYRPDVWSKNPGWPAEMAKATGGRRQPYVPFVVKVAGDDQGLVYDKPVETIVSQELALALLEGGIRRNAQVAEWLDAHRPRSAK